METTSTNRTRARLITAMKPPIPLYDVFADAYTARTKQVLGIVALIAWLGLLFVCVPLFVCMPLTSDTVLYDLQARTVWSGGVAYRDVFETNLPGMVWVHMVVRPLIGDSSVAIRVVDLLVVLTVIVCLAKWLRKAGAHMATCAATGLAISLFYVSTNEWCHCQRDTWMLLPCFAAFALRLRTLQDDAVSVRRSRIEGALWACAFWIKPFTALPGMVCILLVWVLNRSKLRDVGRDLRSILFGGLVIGVIGTVWLLANGAWPHFIDTMTAWNPEYFAAGKARWTGERLQGLVMRFQPWMWLHGLAVPLSLFALGRAIWRKERSTRESTLAMLSGFYLGWLVQSLTLQHLMDYIHVPAVMLAIAVLAGCEWGVPNPFKAVAAVAFFGLAAFMSPLLSPDRLAVWNRCLDEGSSPEVRMALTDVAFPDYENMERVIDYLKDQNPADGQVTCYNVHSIHIYDRLGLKPSTRYLSLSSLVCLFPSRSGDIYSAVDGSRQRFVVTELLESKQQNDGVDPSVTEPRNFPWRHPVVFTAGNYQVHRVDDDPNNRRGQRISQR